MEHAVPGPQDLLLGLIRHASFNELDGERVASDLESHRDLWQAAVMHQPDIDVALMGLTYFQPNWTADTLYISSAGVDDDRLERLARGWGASSVEWENRGDARVLCLWWD
jgi:hypothetical protein